MSGSTLEAMAKAVEGSAVVLICVSKKYKESQVGFVIYDTTVAFFTKYVFKYDWPWFACFNPELTSL